MKKRVVHLVPYDGIGGVETAARSMAGHTHAEFDFHVAFIYGALGRPVKRGDTYNPFTLLRAAWEVVASGTDVLIVSLWRSAIVGVMAKVARPKLQLITFIHLAQDVHWLDRIATRLSIRLSEEVWGDSQASLRQRLPGLPPDKGRVISFVTRHDMVHTQRVPGPYFVFWGRVTAQKGLDRAMRIFSGIAEQMPEATYHVIGPDGGDLTALRRLCDDLGVAGKVTFAGPATMSQIDAMAHDACFYLQTSRFEGMAMSVVESMQRGLVPVVTPVGEIPAYCVHGSNAVIVESDAQAVQDVLSLLRQPERYAIVRSNAITCWRDKAIYADSVLKACEEMLHAE